MEKLIVKHFGAIRDVELELKSLTLFIGKTGTGKSILAKLIALFRDNRFWVKMLPEDSDVKVLFKQTLQYYSIDNFLKPNTYIEYHLDSDMGNITYIYDAGKITQNLFDIIIQNLSIGKTKLDGSDKNIEDAFEIMTRQLFHETVYLPAERSIIPHISDIYAGLERASLHKAFPQTLLDFIARFQIASNIEKLYIDIFDLTYEKVNGNHFLRLENNETILLSESASGMQAIIPVLIVLESLTKSGIPKSYIFEEPELNLFPSAQKQLIELLAEKVLGNGHQMVITTHSPYILDATNNLLYAYEIIKAYPDSIYKISQVFNRSISPIDVVVYSLSSELNKQHAVSLIDDFTQVIPENEFDSALDESMETFDILQDTEDEFNSANH